MAAVTGAQFYAPRAMASVDGNSPQKADENITWESRGKVTFVDGFFSAFKDLPQGEEMLVDMEEAAETPGLYRLVNPYAEWSAVKDGKAQYDATGNYYFVIHAEDPAWVWAEGGDLGVILDGLPTKLHSNVHSLIDAVGLDVMKEKKPEAGGELTDGVISFPVSFKNGYEISTFAITAKGVQWVANSENKLRIKFEGAVEPDYSLSIETKECIGLGEPVNVKVTAGSGIAQIKVRVSPEAHIGQGSYFNTAVAEGETLASGETCSFPAVEGQDIYTVTVVGLDANGKQKSQWLTWVSVYTDQQEGWTEMGEGTFSDAFFPIFGYTQENCSYKVKVERNTANSGLFRVVDPFMNHPAAAEGGKMCEENHSHYMYIDATNPEEVRVTRSNSGIDMGHGMMTIWSVLDAGTEDAQTLKSYGYQIASYNKATNTISFPPTSIYAGCSTQNYCELIHNNTAGSLVLPESTAVDGIGSTADESAVEWYDLTGTRVSTPAKGLYIMKQGTRTRKVVL